MAKRWVLLTIFFVLYGIGFAGAQGVKDGDGKMTLPDGSVYEGQIKNGVFEGKGTLITAHGEQYTGDFKDGLYDGHGVLLYTDGSKYEGEFREGQLNGQGVITYVDGTPPYKGKFKDGDVYVPPVVDSSTAAYEQKSS